MIAHWMRSAWRSLISSPTFSAITIVSLSIGCCGAVLAGSNIYQHLTFERSTPNADRIVMVVEELLDPPQTGPERRRILMIDQNGPIVGPIPALLLPLKGTIAEKLPEIEAQARMIRGASLTQADRDVADARRSILVPAQIGQTPAEPDRIGPPGTVYVDADFFKVMPMTFIEGSAQALQEPDAVILTERKAKQLFPNGPAVGQTIPGVQNHTLKVIGVVRTPPTNTHMNFDVMAGFTTYQLTNGTPQRPVSPWFETDWSRSLPRSFHYIKVKQGVDVAAFRTRAQDMIAQVHKETAPPKLTGQLSKWTVVPLTESHLAGPNVIRLTGANWSPGDMRTIWTLALSAVALMVISGFNYVTLSLARNLRRQREVAIRKVMGAGKQSIVLHYMIESAFMTVIALVIGFGLADLLHPWFARSIAQPETMFALYEPSFLAMAAVFYVLLVLVVGSYPAFYLGSVRPQTGLGDAPAPLPGRFGRFLSSGLLGLQLAAAAGLLIVSATMIAQADFLRHRNMGYVTKDRYEASLPCPPQQQGDGRVIMQGWMRTRCSMQAASIIKRTPGIENAFGFSGTMYGDFDNLQSISRAADTPELGTAQVLTVDPDFLQGMGAKLLAGRTLSNTSAYDRALPDYQRERAALGDEAPSPEFLARAPRQIPVIISRAFLPIIGAATPEAAIGQHVVNPGGGRQGAEPIQYEIVGVIDDWHQRPLTYKVQPMLFLPGAVSDTILQVSADNVESVRAQLEAGWRQAINNPGVRVTLTALDEKLSRAYRADFQLMAALIGFALVAVAVAGMGVYGLSAFEMRRRVREVGIRKALGAEPMQVALAVIGCSTMFAGIATLIAWPFAWQLSQQWLTAFEYRTDLSLLILPAASLAIALFVALAVAINALRAAVIRPNAALRVTG